MAGTATSSFPPSTYALLLAMDISRTASPDPSESIFSDTALTQLEGETAQPFDLTRLRLERGQSGRACPPSFQVHRLPRKACRLALSWEIAPDQKADIVLFLVQISVLL